MTDLVIVSMHEDGFPMGDLYAGFGDTDPTDFENISPAPDSFFTMKKGDSLEAAIAKAKERWPAAKIVEAADDDIDEDDE